jgi:hypothetical protein
MKKAGRRSQAPRWFRRTLQRACRTAHRPGRQRWKTGESCPQAAIPQPEEDFLPAIQQGGGAEGRCRLRTRAEASRSRAGEGKRPLGRRSVNVGSRPSTRPKRRWTRLGATMLSEPWPSTSSWRPLGSDHRPKMLAGIRRKSDWKARCGGRGARCLAFKGRVIRKTQSGVAFGL